MIDRKHYTLVEIIITVVILSAVAIFPLTFLRDSVAGYNQMVLSTQVASRLDRTTHFILRKVSNCRNNGGSVVVDLLQMKILFKKIDGTIESILLLKKNVESDDSMLGILVDGEFYPLLEHVKKFTVENDGLLETLYTIKIIVEPHEDEIMHTFSIRTEASI